MCYNHLDYPRASHPSEWTSPWNRARIMFHVLVLDDEISVESDIFQQLEWLALWKLCPIRTENFQGVSHWDCSRVSRPIEFSPPWGYESIRTDYFRRVPVAREILIRCAPGAFCNYRTRDVVVKLERNFFSRDLAEMEFFNDILLEQCISSPCRILNACIERHMVADVQQIKLREGASASQALCGPRTRRALCIAPHKLGLNPPLHLTPSPFRLANILIFLFLASNFYDKCFPVIQSP